MYRILIIAAAFVIAICGLVFLQGGRNTELADATPAAELTNVTDLSARVSEPTTALAPSGTDDAMADLTTGVLADLGAIAPSAPATGEGDDMRAMTSSVLAGLTGVQAPAPAAPAADLQGIIVQALQQGQSDAYLDALLNEANDSGQILVPGALMTSDGRVDTVTLLASLVQQASATDGPDTAVLIAAAGARPVQTPRADQYYTVTPGDSLAAISLRFYGNTLGYQRIFSANAERLESPDTIQIGQRLLIPGTS